VKPAPDVAADAQLARDAELLLRWGMDSIKVDGCATNQTEAANVMNITYPKLGQALQDAARRLGVAPPWYECEWTAYVGDFLCNHDRHEPCVPLHDVAANCNSSRMFNDIADVWQSPTKQGVKDIIDFWFANPQFAALRNSLPSAQVYYNDPDQLMIGNNALSRTEAEIQMGMWVMLAAPLIMSTELRNGSMSSDMKSILLNREVLAIADDPLGRQATGRKKADLLYAGSTTVWNKTLADGSAAVALLNTGDFANKGAAFNISFNASEVGLSCSRFSARDLFKHQNLGVFDGAYWQIVEETSMVMLKVVCASDIHLVI